MPAPTASDILAKLDEVHAQNLSMFARLDAIAADVAKAASALSDLASARTAAPASNSAAGATLPNYGRRKNEPIHGAPIADLEYYVAGCRRTLDDPAKSRWHDKERVLLAALEAEIARQRGGADTGASVPDGSDDLPF